MTALTDASFASPPIDDWPLARYNYPATATVEVSRATSRTCARTASEASRSARGSNVTVPQLTGLLQKANELDMTVAVKSNSGEPMYTNAGD